MIVDSNESLVIRNYIHEAALAITALRSSDRLLKFLDTLDNIIGVASIYNLDYAITAFVTEVAEDTNAFDAFVFIVGRLEIMTEGSGVDTAVNQMLSKLKNDPIFKDMIIPEVTPSSMFLILYRFFFKEMLAPEVLNDTN